MTRPARKRGQSERDRGHCPDCGKDVTVRRDGGFMPHRGRDNRTCVSPRWAQERSSARPADREHITTVTVERRERVDRAGLVHGRTSRYRGGCSCGWTGGSRESRRTAAAEAGKHLLDAVAAACGTCGRPPSEHPRPGCRRWQYPGQLALDLEGATAC